MKNTNDLRRLLDELADETPEVPAQEWLSGTQHKFRVRRRARVAGAVALVLAAAVAVVPRVVDDASPDPVDPPPKPTDSREWDFPAGTEIHRVLASRMNEPGTSELTWRTTLTHPVWESAGQREDGEVALGLVAWPRRQDQRAVHRHDVAGAGGGGERVEVPDAEFGAAFYSCGNAYPPGSARPGGCAALNIPLRWPDF